jgi:molecular chaperone GrpE
MTEQEKSKEKKSKPAKKNTAHDTIQEMGMKLEELNDKYLRLYSEFDNYRKRTLKEKTELFKTAGEDVITGLLPVLDDFERAIRLSEQTDSIASIREGEILIFNKLKSILQLKGLKEINAVGESFNTDLHDAITNIPAPSEELKGKIIDQTEKGYMLNGKVIRYAKVVVGQ